MALNCERKFLGFVLASFRALTCERYAGKEAWNLKRGLSIDYCPL